MDKGLLLHLIRKKRHIDYRGNELTTEAQQWTNDLVGLVGKDILTKNGIDWVLICERMLSADIPADDASDRVIENDRT